MTVQTLMVIKVLLDDPLGDHYGLAISKQARLPTGSVYPILARLERAGWVSSDWERIDPVVEGRRPRRYYSLTGFGRQRGRQALEDVQRSVFSPRPQPQVPLADQGLA